MLWLLLAGLDMIVRLDTVLHPLAVTTPELTSKQIA